MTDPNTPSHESGSQTLDVNRFVMRHGIFVRGARDAARQALYFLDFLHPSTSSRCQAAVESHWKGALHQARGLLRGVYVPKILSEARGMATAAQRPRVEELSRTADEWSLLLEKIEEAYEAPGYPRQNIGDARAQLVRFLSESRTSKGDQRAEASTERFTQHYMAGVQRWLLRHLAFFLAVVLVLGVGLFVEAVSGLLLNQGPLVFLYLLLLPLMAYIHLMRQLVYLRQGKLHSWDVGRWSFWRPWHLVKSPGRQIPRWPVESRLWQSIAVAQTIRVGVYLAAAALGVATVYLIRQSSPLTVPIVLCLFYAIILLAEQLDFWDFISVYPIRFTALCAAVVVLLGLRLGMGRQAFTLLFLGLALALFVFHLFSRRRKRFVAGLGVACLVIGVWLVAAMFTHERRNWRLDADASQVTHVTLGEWPYPSTGNPPVVIMAASGGGSRAAVYTAKTLAHLEQDLPEIAGQLQLISSVSGGSLANAAYVARRSGCGSAKDPMGLVEATRQDFLYPTLMGALVPFRTRGKAIEKAWQEGGVGLGDCSLGDLAKLWRKRPAEPEAPPFPMPMFNTATLDGHNLVISPLSREFYINQEQRNRAQSVEHTVHQADPGDMKRNPFTWVFHRDGIYSLEDLLGKRDLPLSSAVLASANFPFGFPVVKLELDSGQDWPLFFSPKPDHKMVKLTDGGALSNSGMWPLFQLLVNRRDQLKDRGVLLIIVEASKMPRYEGFASTFNSLLGTIGDQGGIGRNLHERMLDVLELLYCDRLATVQLDLIPRKYYNVHTTWALDKVSIEKLDESFDDRWSEEVDGLRKKWRYLRHGEPLAVPLVDRSRPPLD